MCVLCFIPGHLIWSGFLFFLIRRLPNYESFFVAICVAEIFY